MRVLFTHSYFYQLDAKQWKAAQPYPPLATIVAAATARENGHHVSLFDTNLLPNEKGLATQLEDFQPDVLVIYDDGFNYLTKMCLTSMREAAFNMAAMAKQKGIKVWVCSSDSTDHYDTYLKRNCDVAILGEGELTLLDLLNDSEISSIHGIAYNQDGASIKTAPRAINRTIDELPDAAWDLVDIEAYKKIWLSNHGFFSLNMATTRGCPYKCNWCAKPIYGNRYNSRSPKRVAAEIQKLVIEFGASHIWMCDDIFGLKPNWVQEFTKEIENLNYSFKYKIQSRADLLVKDDTAANLAKSGCNEVWIGAESGSQFILDAMDKGITIEQLTTARKLLLAHNIKACFFLQFGYPGETKEHLRETLKMLETLKPDDIGASVSYPLPGTIFYEKVKHELAKKSNWSDSDDLDMMFTGTYPREFYKILHRYVHKYYRLLMLDYQKDTAASKYLKQLYFTLGKKYFHYKIKKYIPEGLSF